MPHAVVYGGIWVVWYVCAVVYVGGGICVGWYMCGVVYVWGGMCVCLTQ